jgi:nucleotide-binding universal stress UspA family protein
MTTRIVVPLDQSPIAESALPLARTLAKQLNARVTLLSVLDVPASFSHYMRPEERVPAGSAPPPRMPAEATPQSPYGHWTGWSSQQPTAGQIDEISGETAAAERYLDAIAKTFDSEMIETVVRYGRPAERILQTAESRDNAMIVLASHGRGGLGRAVVGSVAGRVAQAATRPLFVVRAQRESVGSGELDPIKRMLIPVDGSAFSEQAIAVVNDLFAETERNLHLINVIETPRFANGAQSESYVQWLAEQIDQPNVKVEFEIAKGNPATQITEAADRHGVDLIAMSTHGRTGLDRFVIGSVAERVLQEADRPLLLIPARMTV